jgi:hypothetical protein
MGLVERLPAVPEDDSRQLKQGDRVRLSELGMSRYPRYAGREARVVGGCKNPSGIRVVWEQSRTAVAMHKSFLKLLAAAATASASCTSADAG